MVKNKEMQFFLGNLKMKRNGLKNFLTFQSGDSKPRFLVVILAPLIWISQQFEGDEIKSKNVT